MLELLEGPSMAVTCSGILFGCFWDQVNFPKKRGQGQDELKQVLEHDAKILVFPGVQENMVKDGQAREVRPYIWVRIWLGPTWQDGP